MTKRSLKLILSLAVLAGSLTLGLPKAESLSCPPLCCTPSCRGAGVFPCWVGPNGGCVCSDTCVKQ